MSIWDQAFELNKELKSIHARKKAFDDLAQNEMETNLPEIMYETRYRFNLSCLTAIKAKFSLSRKSGKILLYDRLYLIFNIGCRVYYVEEYVANIIRVFDKNRNEPLNCYFNKCISFRRSKEDLERLGDIDMRYQKSTFNDCQQYMEDVGSIVKAIDGRVETILTFIRSRYVEYFSKPVRQIKQNVRIILHARKMGDGDFGLFPREIVRIICKKCLKMI